uniref:Uncharacterized protein n=1 Tax=Anguilla anguilla TaxID=7936 RepID=A0A0E9RC23_ANGAN
MLKLAVLELVIRLAFPGAGIAPSNSQIPRTAKM